MHIYVYTYIYNSSVILASTIRCNLDFPCALTVNQWRSLLSTSASQCVQFWAPSLKNSTNCKR